MNWLVFITELISVYRAVQTGSLNKAVCASSSKGLKKSQTALNTQSKFLRIAKLSIWMSKLQRCSIKAVWVVSWGRKWKDVDYWASPNIHPYLNPPPPSSRLLSSRRQESAASDRGASPLEWTQKMTRLTELIWQQYAVFRYSQNKDH